MTPDDMPLHVDLVVTAMWTVGTAETSWIVTLVLEMTLQVPGMYVGLAATWTAVATVVRGVVNDVGVVVIARLAFTTNWYLGLVPQTGELAEAWKSAKMSVCDYYGVVGSFCRGGGW